MITNSEWMQSYNDRLTLASEILAIMQEAEREYLESGNASALSCQKAQAHAVAGWVQDREEVEYEP